MGHLGFLFGIENELEKRSIVVLVNDKRILGDVILGVDYLKVDKTEFFILDKFHDLKEFLVMDNAKLKFGKISVSKDKIVSFKDFVFWFGSKEYSVVRELLFIIRVDDKAVLNAELSRRTQELFKVFEKYLQ